MPYTSLLWWIVTCSWEFYDNKYCCYNNYLALNHSSPMSMQQKKRLYNDYGRYHSTSKILFLIATLSCWVLWEKVDVMMLGKVIEIIIDQTYALC